MTDKAPPADVEVTERSAQKRGLRKKKEAAPDTRSAAEREIDDAIARSSVKKSRDQQRKRNFKYGLGGGAALLLAYGIYVLAAPINGTMAFGVCKVLLELQTPYPPTLELSTVEQFATSVRIWFVHTDSFGEYKMQSMQCFFKPDNTGRLPFIVDKVSVDRHDLDPKIVADFNRSLPVLFANPPDLALPWELPDSLGDLQIDENHFRKPIL